MFFRRDHPVKLVVDNCYKNYANNYAKE